MKFMSKSYNENKWKFTTQRMKNAYELNIHKNKMILQFWNEKTEKIEEKNWYK